MNKELIQALKDNEKPFGLMTAEMRTGAKELGKNGYFSCWDERGWTEINKDTYRFIFKDGIVYRLRPDYEEPKEEPEVVFCIGDRFANTNHGKLYILASVRDNAIDMINLDSGTRWNTVIKNVDVRHITEDEMKPLLASFTRVWDNRTQKEVK